MKQKESARTLEFKDQAEGPSRQKRDKHASDQVHRSEIPPFKSSLEHILAELARLDLLLQAQVARARYLYDGDKEFRGLYISEAELDNLLQQPVGLPKWTTEPTPLAIEDVRATLYRTGEEIEARRTESVNQGILLRLDELKRLFKLTKLDLDILLVALAPELDLRYERIYGYLHDDITKKRPSVDLALNLLSPSWETKVENRQRFLSGAALLKWQLLQLFDDPNHHQPQLLNKFLKIDERIVNFLLESDKPDVRITPFVEMRQPGYELEELMLSKDLKEKIIEIDRCCVKNQSFSVWNFQGTDKGVKQHTAETLCHRWGWKLFVVDTDQVFTNQTTYPFETLVTFILREALLQNAGLYWEQSEQLFSDERIQELKGLGKQLDEWTGPLFFSTKPGQVSENHRSSRPLLNINFPPLTSAARFQQWSAALNGSIPLDTHGELKKLANTFKLTSVQISQAVKVAKGISQVLNLKTENIQVADLYEAARQVSNQTLGKLAKKVIPHYTWSDLVLPIERVQQLREIVSQVKYRSVVFEKWGFNKKLSLGKGVVALFAGPSGTGKTMAAEVMANELRLELYKIDLSMLVSKYIGETEKNLSRIFSEAETSNAILFFDEADALFGKRSEVKDAHDRYANIEVGYLLQKIEEYNGIVILATNIRKNMDDAFVRRLNAIVEFPLPSEISRKQIWEKIWPEEIPLDKYVDLTLLASHFEMTGGHIRNVALASAFLALDNGQVVTMDHLLQATKWEYQKMGKVLNAGELEKIRVEPMYHK